MARIGKTIFTNSPVGESECNRRADDAVIQVQWEGDVQCTNGSQYEDEARHATAICNLAYPLGR